MSEVLSSILFMCILSLGINASYKIDKLFENEGMSEVEVDLVKGSVCGYTTRTICTNIYRFDIKIEENNDNL